jgi:spore coat protein CotH
MQRERRKLRDQFDANHDGKLDSAERALARQFLLQEKMAAAWPRAAFEPPKGAWRGPFAGRTTPGRGPKVSFDDVVHPLKVSPYDASTLRTLFLSFGDSRWETQLSDFHETDIEVPATLHVDTRTVLREVGVRFRGMSSYMMVPAGYKRSLNISIDAINEKQNWQGIHTLNLLNSHEDPTYLRVLLYQEIARHHIPTPKANLVHLVINDESWGIYVNAEQFNADFVEAGFGTRRGARFKVTGSPMGRGGLEYLGDDPSPYTAIYDLKTKKTNQVWFDLIRLCKVLNQTPVENLHVALEPLLDIDETLKFLALENVLINNDGYWVRASDYNLYQDPSGKFHVIPHETNEKFMSAEHVPGFNKGGPAPGVKLDPLTGLDDPTKPLRQQTSLGRPF